MAVDQDDLEPILSDDDSTVCTANTPPETVTTDLQDDHEPLDGAEPGSYLVPWPDSTFIIRSVKCGRVITLLDGQITLTQRGTLGSIHWVCVENDGWLGFRNAASGKYLGHNGKGGLYCSAGSHSLWEYFRFSMTPDEGCILLMRQWDPFWHTGLWRVGIKTEQGVEKLGKVGDGGSDGVVWEFAKV